MTGAWKVEARSKRIACNVVSKGTTRYLEHTSGLVTSSQYVQEQRSPANYRRRPDKTEKIIHLVRQNGASAVDSLCLYLVHTKESHWSTKNERVCDSVWEKSYKLPMLKPKMKQVIEC